MIATIVVNKTTETFYDQVLHLIHSAWGGTNVI